MKIDLPPGGYVCDPIVVVQEDLESIGHSYKLAVKLIKDIQDALRPFGIFVDAGRSEDALRIRPKDVYGTKSWTAAFDFDVVGSQSHMFSHFFHVSALARRFMRGWEITVTAGEKGTYRRENKSGVPEKDLSKVTLRLIRKVDNQGKRLQPIRKAS